ncbi:hypothetical protein GCM10009788_47830 [Nocardioides humi]|uniref:Uncharacterized protein n=1 Tax=Nocardioides humi TaxID=449461 RepID=A0ABN2BFW1_9ACTN
MRWLPASSPQFVRVERVSGAMFSGSKLPSRTSRHAADLRLRANPTQPPDPQVNRDRPPARSARTTPAGRCFFRGGVRPGLSPASQKVAVVNQWSIWLITDNHSGDDEKR